MEAQEIVRFNNVSFSFEQTPVLRDVSLSIEAGDFVSVIGPNGGGKTTLARLMLGLLKPDSGWIRVFNKSPYVSRKRLGYVPQFSLFDPQFPATVMDVALMGRLTRGIGFYSREDKEAAVKALEEVGLQGLEKRSFSELSGGQRQRLLIARAVAGDPELLLLDEPTSSVDTAVEKKIGDLLQTLHKRMTIIMITHDLGFVSQCVDKLVCVNTDVRLHHTEDVTAEMIQTLYGAPVKMVDHTSEIHLPEMGGSCDE